MSYRAFKHLLGETSLERKCRFLFGAGTLLLITGSFWLYALQTESLAYKQVDTTGRLLVSQRLWDLHWPHVRVGKWHWDTSKPEASNQPAGPLEEFGTERWQQLYQALSDVSEENLRAAVRDYDYRIIKPKARKRENQPDDSFEADRLKEFLEDSTKNEY